MLTLRSVTKPTGVAFSSSAVPMRRARKTMSPSVPPGCASVDSATFGSTVMWSANTSSRPPSVVTPPLKMTLSMPASPISGGAPAALPYSFRKPWRPMSFAIVMLSTPAPPVSRMDLTPGNVPVSPVPVSEMVTPAVDEALCVSTKVSAAPSPRMVSKPLASTPAVADSSSRGSIASNSILRREGGPSALGLLLRCAPCSWWDLVVLDFLNRRITISGQCIQPISTPSGSLG